MTRNNSPLDILLTAEIERLRTQEKQLVRTLYQLEHGTADPASWDRFLASLTDVQNRAQRVERMLEAMDGCGFARSEPFEVPVHAESGAWTTGELAYA